MLVTKDVKVAINKQVRELRKELRGIGKDVKEIHKECQQLRQDLKADSQRTDKTDSDKKE